MSTLTKPDPNRPYWREEIDKEFDQVKKWMHREALERGRAYDGENKALYHDCYTGKMLRGGDKYDYEHIRSSEEIFMQYRGRYTNEQIAKIVNCPENVAVTLRSINISKGKRRMEDWLAVPGNVEKHGVDVKLVRKVLERADRGIQILTKTIINN